MPALPEGYVRKGTLAHFQMDNDALSMLKEVAPTTKSYGRYLRAVRRDYALRQQWAKARSGTPSQTPPRHPCHQWELKLTGSSRKIPAWQPPASP